MRRVIEGFWDHPPARVLRWLTLVALAPRLLAAFFSPGYFAHDDHFLVIEAAGSWCDGSDYNDWLPWNQGDEPTPSGHSFFYVGLHYLLFSALKAMGLRDPRVLMFVVRVLHAAWSLVAVRAGYRIAERLAGPRTAWRTGLFLALFCYMPFLSVRNLVEVACIPLLMLGCVKLLDADQDRHWRSAVIGGLWVGLAMNVRFQTIFFAMGPGLAFLLMLRWKQALAYAIGVALPLLIIQGGIDLFLWGRPWAEVTQYVLYNLDNTTTYGVLPWYNYVLLLIGLLIPPLSIAVLFGFARRPRPLLLWLPVLLFIAIHSWFPNKQERFLLPIVPLFFVLGYVSWEQWRAASAWWRQREGLWRGALRFVWCLNLLLLPFLSATYSKRSRVEAMLALRTERPLGGLIVEDPEEAPAMPPLFYLGQWDMGVFMLGPDKAEDDFGDLMRKRGVAGREHHVLFVGEDRLAERMARMEESYGPVRIIGRAEPGLIDRLVHWLNPVNRNEVIIFARLSPRASN